MLTSPTESDSYSSQNEEFRLEQGPYTPEKPVKVIIVGAGIAGIAASILLPTKVPNLSYVLFEKNGSVSGGWTQNRYPGVRCDVPSHAYQLTFAPNPNWSEYYAPGEEIRRYYEDVVQYYGVDKHLKLKHEVLSAVWNDDTAEWEVMVRNLTTGQEFLEKADFFVSAQGRINKPKAPEIPGLTTTFQGHVCHTATWDESYDFSGKRIAVVGNGASGIQVLVNLLSRVEHISHFVRSRQWVLPTFAAGFIEAKSSLPGGYVFTKAEKDKFASDPRAYLEFRKGIEKRLHPGNKGGVAGSPENESIKQRCIESMRERLGGDEEWLRRLLPNYAPGCKRTTPAPGYLEALLTSQVTYVDTPISHATSTGLVDHQGTERHVDAIILATGFENGFRPLFPTIGRNGVDLNRQWAPDGPIGYPETYFGVMAPEMPNYFAVLQAQSYAVGGTVPLHCELSATYIAKVIRKVQSQGYKSVAPSQEATADFNEYVDQYFADKVTSDSCNSWLKNGTGKSRTLFGWPGTGHHRINILKEPRWEDFVFQRSETGRRNRYHYFGNGSTEEDEAKDLDALTGYLEEVGKVDLARLHER
ncbi:hypothetical protein HRR83_008758 [Exophiala dermatitidis]|uniref:Cyclohexanone monooxygenase n=1 Tax=Exophiala dermatitidis TaxID=5970 RepID=A0AAN6ISU5_EXODE|nr:hypothetical protein HRR75_007967 [Exophiala dermatitidis]KAJ4505300.1 hypothetical protein HRR73_008573 [Exophiala dermatitidis]KAJ4505759.1 hypothetical protein HRR74_008670 [Exophiala dermatitidis]KAJ4536308.1 hypothetical protein HRR77_007235 [Exophiala dermatitidis]KAJ4541163.1 hypothetical protein HRR76_004534 [Exophiala dermatitidis]